MGQSDIFRGRVIRRFLRHEPLLEVSTFNTRWNVFESVAYFYIVFYNNISH